MNSNKSGKKHTERWNIYRNIPLDYIFTFLKNLDMSTSVWVLYLAFKGMNLWQIGILEGVYHITSMICEIPLRRGGGFAGAQEDCGLGTAVHRHFLYPNAAFR
ncbi:MAG: hypothetical protein ACLSA0_11935 [Eisenbergiella massiliensis]